MINLCADSAENNSTKYEKENDSNRVYAVFVVYILRYINAPFLFKC
jgi:hypothetical protein